jgi:lysophospholipase L1-like esterase
VLSIYAKINLDLQSIIENLKKEKPLTWLFYGDSITHGAFHTFGHREYAEIFEERIRHELDRRMDVVINTAISGDKASDLIETFDWRVKRFLPDITFMMIGMNDCCKDYGITCIQFHDNLDKLISMFHEINSVLVLQTSCPILPESASNREKYFPDYMDVIRKISVARKIPLMDHAKYWHQNIDRHYYWMSDGIHPNEYGHRVFADLIFKELGLHDSGSRTCQLFIP